jgi:hypothetical protein
MPEAVNVPDPGPRVHPRGGARLGSQAGAAAGRGPAPAPGYPRSARGCAAGPDLRRLIQLPVVSRLPIVQLALKPDRTLRGIRPRRDMGSGGGVG